MLALKSIKYFHATTRIYLWKSKGMSEECIEKITKSDGNFAQTFANHHLLPGINLNEHCLTKSNIYIPKNLVNLYISYTLGPQLRNTNTDVILSNCLFGSEKLTKNDDPDK